jgi:hypothetical protein
VLLLTICGCPLVPPKTAAPLSSKCPKLKWMRSVRPPHHRLQCNTGLISGVLTMTSGRPVGGCWSNPSSHVSTQCLSHLLHRRQVSQSLRIQGPTQRHMTNDPTLDLGRWNSNADARPPANQLDLPNRFSNGTQPAWESLYLGNAPRAQASNHELCHTPRNESLYWGNTSSGGATVERLRAIKAEVDPTNVFQCPQCIGSSSARD